MNVSEFARQLGVSPQAIRKACASGRLSRSLTRDERGRVIAIDAKLGAEEWERRRTRLTPARTTPMRDTAPVVARLLELVAELQADSREHVAEALPFVVEAAADALRSSGRPSTAEAVAKALALDAGLDGPALAIASALLDAVEDMDTGKNEIREVARRAGRAAVLAEGLP
jgi:hypothetical protein